MRESKPLEHFGERFDSLEREMVGLKADVRTSIGALKESIEARDFASTSRVDV